MTKDEGRKVLQRAFVIRTRRGGRIGMGDVGRVLAGEEGQRFALSLHIPGNACAGKEIRDASTQCSSNRRALARDAHAAGRLLGWYDTYQALILPPAFSAFSTFLLRQYFLGIPRDLDEAPRIGGANSLRIWWQVLMPLAGPAIAVLATFVSLNTWNDFLWPLIITNSPEMRTLPVGLSTFQGQYKTDWNLLMAGSVIAMLPVLLVYMVGQRWFIRGITLSGLGGR
jgi:hypothetical protein